MPIFRRTFKCLQTTFFYVQLFLLKHQILMGNCATSKDRKSKDIFSSIQTTPNANQQLECVAEKAANKIEVDCSQRYENFAEMQAAVETAHMMNMTPSKVSTSDAMNEMHDDSARLGLSQSFSVPKTHPVNHSQCVCTCAPACVSNSLDTCECTNQQTQQQTHSFRLNSVISSVSTPCRHACQYHSTRTHTHQHHDNTHSTCAGGGKSGCEARRTDFRNSIAVLDSSKIGFSIGSISNNRKRSNELAASPLVASPAPGIGAHLSGRCSTNSPCHSNEPDSCSVEQNSTASHYHLTQLVEQQEQHQQQYSVQHPPVLYHAPSSGPDSNSISVSVADEHCELAKVIPDAKSLRSSAPVTHQQLQEKLQEKHQKHQQQQQHLHIDQSQLSYVVSVPEDLHPATHHTKNCQRHPTTKKTVSPTAAGTNENTHNASVAVQEGGGSTITTSAKLFVCIFAYVRRTDQEISLDKRDLVCVLNDSNPHWWLVQPHRELKAHAHTLAEPQPHQTGFVPANHLAPQNSIEAEYWFYANITKREAEYLLLSTNEPGAFLVRSSETTPHNAVCISVYSIRDGMDYVRHYKIHIIASSACAQCGGGSSSSALSEGAPFYTCSCVRYVMNEKFRFGSIPELIANYRVHEGLSSRLTRLVTPACPLVADISYATHDKWEIDLKCIEFRDKLGSGNFGIVYKGIINKFLEVAVKTLKPGSMTRDDFLNEARTMKSLSHANLVQLFAVVSHQEPMMIVTEFMEHGSLLEYLQNSENRQHLKPHVLMEFLYQTAKGMAYLEAHRYIHRDLAARNILINSRLQAKIADFGLARLLSGGGGSAGSGGGDADYVARPGARLPIKWTAPEAAIYHKFSHKSDVWAYGVVAFEVTSLGEPPYRDMDNIETLAQVEAGYRLARPPACPHSLYVRMLEMWNAEPKQRPNFADLVSAFEQFEFQV